MGMFDHLFIDTDMLPVSEEEKIKLGKDKEWQTKDFDCILTEIYITRDGELKINTWNYEEVPKEERPYPDDDGIMGLIGSLRRVNEELKTLNHHGRVRFYSYLGDPNDDSMEWYEFEAKFTDGKLVEIKRIKDED